MDLQQDHRLLVWFSQPNLIELVIHDLNSCHHIHLTYQNHKNHRDNHDLHHHWVKGVSNRPWLVRSLAWALLRTIHFSQWRFYEMMDQRGYIPFHINHIQPLCAHLFEVSRTLYSPEEFYPKPLSQKPQNEKHWTCYHSKTQMEFYLPIICVEIFYEHIQHNLWPHPIS